MSRLWSDSITDKTLSFSALSALSTDSASVVESVTGGWLLRLAERGREPFRAPPAVKKRHIIFFLKSYYCFKRSVLL